MLFRTLLALAVAAASPAVAQPGSAGAAAPTPEAIAAALELLPQDMLEQQMVAASVHLIDAMIEEQTAAARRRGEDMPDELVQRIRVLIHDENRTVVESVLPTIRNDAAMIYARYFTAEELRELRRIQQLPVMRRAERLMPEIMAELSRIGMRAAADRQPELQRRISELVEQWFAEQDARRARPRT